MTNQFDSKGGEQNTGIGDHAIGKQVNNYYGDIPPAVFAEYAGKLAVTDSALASFFKILEEQQVPPGDLDSKLREIAGQYKELLLRLETVQSEDPQVVRLKDEARQAIELGEYAKAEELLNQAEARDVQAFEQLEANAKRDMEAARKRRISAAATNADQARAQRVQLRYAKAAAYWQQATALLPEESKRERSLYLHEAAYDLDYIAPRYTEALSLYEQSLHIRQEIGDRAGEGTTLNNISQIYRAKGNYDKALKYLEQSLVLFREIGDRVYEGRTLNNIGRIYYAQEDYSTAWNYLEQSLAISQEIGNRMGKGEALADIGMIHYAKGDYDKALPLLVQSLIIRQELGDREDEGITLSNIGLIYDALGDYAMSLKYLERSLTIQRDIGYKSGEAVTIWNIGRAYEGQGDLAKAEQYMSRSVQLEEEIGHPNLEKARKHLADIRAKLKGR